MRQIVEKCPILQCYKSFKAIRIQRQMPSRI